MRIETEVKLDFKDVLIRPKRSTLSTRSNVDISREYHFRNAQDRLPRRADHRRQHGHDRDLRDGARADPFELSTALHKHYAVDELSRSSRPRAKSRSVLFDGHCPGRRREVHRVMAAAGTGADAAIRYVCVDVANGYTESFVRFVAKVRERCPHLVIMAGNVVTGEMTEELILSGADIVKVGIGPGSVCTTRKMTGVGYPQLRRSSSAPTPRTDSKATSAPTAAARRRAMWRRLSAAEPIS